ncbi:MAG: hypothetical protein U1F39_09940 [Steroidobacteraceae bacterium]
MTHAALPEKTTAAGEVAPGSARPAALQKTLQHPLVRRTGELLIDAAWRLRHLGPRRGASLALLLASILAALFIVWPLKERATALERQLLQHPAVTTVDAAPREAAARTRLARVDELPAVLSTLTERAQAAGLELAAGNYRLLPGKSGAASRYEIGLPVIGPYPGVRQFIEASLAAVPAMALDGLSLQRPDVASARVAVEVRFVVFVAEGA